MNDLDKKSYVKSKRHNDHCAQSAVRRKNGKIFYT
jgi:hypothetical protein